MKQKTTAKLRFPEILIPLLALVCGILVLVFGEQAVSQASLPSPMPQSFSGEYSRDRITWYPLDQDASLSALQGDLYLRGSFTMEMFSDSVLYYYSDHIGAELTVDGVCIGSNVLMELEEYGLDLQPTMCGRGWKSWYFSEPVTPESHIELHLVNPHRFGNEDAYRYFLQTLYGSPNSMNLLSHWLSSYGRPFMIVGVILILASLMLLGASAAAVFGRVPTGGRLIKLGLLCCFGGGFLIFDTVNLTFWSEWNIINTYGLILCQFMAVYMMGLLARDSLTGKRRQAASIAAVLSGAVVTGIILISCLGPVLIYDTLFLWTAVQLPVNIFLMILGILELADRSRKPGRDAVFFPLLFLCLTVDMTGITKSIFCQGSLTKAGILIYLICTFFKAAGDIISDHKASARAEKLEQELEQSRIAVMLSQIHPHFIFNVLGTIRGLCREDPEQAWQAIGDFSSYLRGNMNALTNTSSIPFDSELLHVQTYLRLEQLRLGEKLRIVYDIREKDFCLPPLTLQPLVENAVKHGIFYKKEGGTVTIRTMREEDRILIRVEDDGLGFDPQQAALNARTHEPIGITNVCNRVKTMLGGTLTLDSNPGCGTAVTIAFPYSNNERGA